MCKIMNNNDYSEFSLNFIHLLRNYQKIIIKYFDERIYLQNNRTLLIYFCFEFFTRKISILLFPLIFEFVFGNISEDAICFQVTQEREQSTEMMLTWGQFVKNKVRKQKIQ